MNPRYPRLWLILFSVLVLVLTTGVIIWAVAPGVRGLPCPPNCMVNFITPFVFNSASVETADTDELFTFILVMAAIVFILVESFLLLAVLRFRNRPPETAMQFHGNTKLEMAWTAAPAVILAMLLGFTLQTMGEVRAVEPENVIQVKVIGHQWWWEFQYPELGITTANEFVVPVNTTVEVAVESVDVVHSFWAPELFGKVDAVPGYTNRVRFTPTVIRSDYFAGQCAEFCGTQHAQMRFAVVVRSAEDFQAWVTLMQQEAALGQLSGDAAAGRDLFLGSACIGCHTIAGAEQAAGKTGPNLTHLASRGFIAGGALANTPQNVRMWVRDAPSIKPGVAMPSFATTFNDQQLDQLAVFLTMLR